MELLIAIPLCLFFITLTAVGAVYFGIDNQKERAAVCIRLISRELDEWACLAARITEAEGLDTAPANKLRTLSAEYFSLNKRGGELARIPLVNSMAETIQVLVGSAKPDSVRALAEFEFNAERFDSVRREYNYCVGEQHSRLDKRANMFIGKLFRVQRLEKLKDITKAAIL